MQYIREPKDVDLIIKSEPLTESARKEISEFIREYRNKSDLKPNILQSAIPLPQTQHRITIACEPRHVIGKRLKTWFYILLERQ